MDSLHFSDTLGTIAHQRGVTAYNYLAQLDYDSNCNQDFIAVPGTYISGTQPPQRSVYLIERFSSRYGFHRSGFKCLTWENIGFINSYECLNALWF